MAKKLFVVKEDILKIYVNRKPIAGPWGGGNLFVKALYEHLPNLKYKIVENPFNNIPDIIFLQSPKADEQTRFSINEAIFLKSKNPKIKIIMRVNDCDARKATSGVDDMWIECSKYVDLTVFVSSWMKKYFLSKGWHCKNNFVVYNGVDLEHFKSGGKIDNGKINIVTHHWSSNRMKGFNEYEAIDKFVGINKDFTFTYIGRELGTFKNTEVIKPIFGKVLGETLSRYDVYISGSKYDPGPNHILESLACKLPTIVCKNGGGSLEFTSNNVYNDTDDLIDMLKNKRYKFKSNINVKDWKECVTNYSKVLRGVKL